MLEAGSEIGSRIRGTAAADARGEKHAVGGLRPSIVKCKLDWVCFSITKIIHRGIECGKILAGHKKRPEAPRWQGKIPELSMDPVLITCSSAILITETASESLTQPLRGPKTFEAGV